MSERVCPKPTHHLHVALHDTPEIAAADLNRVAGCQAAGLQVPAELVEYRLLEVSEDANRREEVIEV